VKCVEKTLRRKHAPDLFADVIARTIRCHPDFIDNCRPAINNCNQVLQIMATKEISRAPGLNASSLVATNSGAVIIRIT